MKRVPRPSAHWRGAFGDAYTQRHEPTPQRLKGRVRWFRQILEATRLPRTAQVLEVGANRGMNLLALASLKMENLYGVDVNETACRALYADGRNRHRVRVAVGNALRLPYQDRSVDLVLTCGLLIHVHPRELLHVCEELIRVSRRYILCLEYFSPKPEDIMYREQKELLFKRDFGGFLLDHWTDLRLVNYGFLWKRVEPAFDNVTWWLLKRLGPGGHRNGVTRRM